MVSFVQNSFRNRSGQVALGIFLGLVLVLAIEAVQWNGQWGVEITEEGGVSRLRITEGREKLRVDARGKVELDAEESTVVGLEEGAFLEIESRRPGTRRRLEVVRGEDGKPRMKYSVGRREVAMDAEARAWVAEVLPRIYRLSGWDAEGRAERLRRRGGVEAVLAEVEAIGRDFVQVLYLGYLANKAPLDAGELVRVVETAGKELGSDHTLARFLANLGPEALGETEVTEAFAAACQTIGSDYELRQLLTERLAKRPPGAHEVELFLEAARGIGSDHEMANFLVDLAEEAPRDIALGPLFAERLASVQSDFEQRRAAAALLDPVRPQDLDHMLSVVHAIGNDFTLVELLSEVSRVYPAGQPLPAVFFERVDSVQSDFELRRLLSGVLERPSLEAQNLEALLNSARGIGSDFELAELLLKVLARHPEVGSSPAFEGALGTVDSRFEHGRVAEALARVNGEAAPAEAG